MDTIIKIALETIAQNKQAIVFCPSRSSSEKTAEDISKLTNLQCHQLAEDALNAGSVATKQCQRLSKIIKKGVAFHHAGLLQKQKSLIEAEFKSGKIKVICATPTLAVGLSLPVFRVIIKSLKRFSGRWGMNWIPVLEYLQMAGRAGRPEYEAFGEAVCVAKTAVEKQEIYERYVLGEPEDIFSKLAVEPVLRTYLLSLISAGVINNKKSMRDFFAKTFWAHQFKDLDKLTSLMDQQLGLLTSWGFVFGIKDDFVAASEVKNEQKLKATPIGRRVSELYLDPLTAKHLLECMEKFTNQDVFSLLQMISSTLEMRPLIRIKSSEGEKIQEQLTARYESLLMEEPSAYDIEYPDFMNSIKTALFFESWIEETGEDLLLDKFGVRPGEVRAKIEAAKWLLHACHELAKIHQFREVITQLRKLEVRIKHGVREELLMLLKLKGVGRKRARKLYDNGIKDLGDIKEANMTTLTQLVGGTLAASVKRQMGDNIIAVPERKRVGQMSLMKF